MSSSGGGRGAYWGLSGACFNIAMADPGIGISGGGGVGGGGGGLLAVSVILFITGLRHCGCGVGGCCCAANKGVCL